MEGGDVITKVDGKPVEGNGPAPPDRWVKPGQKATLRSGAVVPSKDLVVTIGEDERSKRASNADPRRVTRRSIRPPRWACGSVT